MEGGQALTHKSSADELKDFFDDAVPDYDKERVYVSDIKKVIQWYNILQANELLDFTEEVEKETKSEDQEEKSEEEEKENNEA